MSDRAERLRVVAGNVEVEGCPGLTHTFNPVLGGGSRNELVRLGITPSKGSAPAPPAKASSPPEPTELTLTVNSATSTVDLKTGKETDSGTYAYGNYNVIPTQTPPGQALVVSAHVNAPLPKGWTIELSWTGSPTPICTAATEETCGDTVRYPAGAANVSIGADIHDPQGAMPGVSIIAAADPNCTDGKTAAQDGGSCPGSR